MSKATTRSKLAGIAHHEAGHAVIAYVCNQRLHSVTVKPKGARLGRAIFSGRISARDSAVITLAGPAAETRYWGRNQYAHMLGDVQALRQQDPDGALAAYTAVTRQYVKLYWPAIQALAAQLLAAGTLTGGAAEAIIAPVVQDCLQKAAQGDTP